MLTRKEILKKIQEWAKENSGHTPSEKIIREELGIPKWEWITYWTKTSDIQREAGLTPQVFDNTKYTREELCNLFIKLIREKDKWPSRDELDFKRRQDAKFPASATFYKQLGLTRNLAQALLEYIEDKQGYGDITDICNSVLENQKEQDSLTQNENLVRGFVCLGKQHGEYKIGFTKDLNRRREDITLLGSEPIEWIHTIETDDMKGVEDYWHNRFKDKLKRGEWFKLNKDDVKAFRRWKKIL